MMTFDLFSCMVTLLALKHQKTDSHHWQQHAHNILCTAPHYSFWLLSYTLGCKFQQNSSGILHSARIFTNFSHNLMTVQSRLLCILRRS